MLSPPDFAPFPRAELEQSLPRRFERQAALHPGRPAVGVDGEVVTYAELAGRARAAARAVWERSRGGPSTVAILCAQGAPLVAAILGALGAGRTYVPLDRSQPAERLEPLLDDAGAALILTDAATAALAWALGGNRRDVVDVETLATDDAPLERPAASDPFAPAYVYYTSGSTGRPKGVVDAHRNVLHNVMRYTNSLRIAPGDRLTLLQASHLSGAVSSLFGALLNGASVHPFDVAAHSAGELAEYVARERITIYHSVPSIFRSFLAGDRRFPDVRVVRLEGDRASRLDVELLRRHFSDRCVLVNGLGATETGLIRQHFVELDTPVDDGLLPVGGPVEDMEVLLLDEEGRPAAPGTVGEIAVRSEFLATGYWRAPERTARAFLPDPAGGPRRTYRSGDLGRLRPDGCLELLGRRDLRAKIRGQSVEVADVEGALLGLPSVGEAAVAVQARPDGEARLVAWVAPREPQATASALRRQLAERLPSPMVPTRFVLLDALPLQPGGKLDRRALPPPGPDRPQLESSYAPPATSLESLLAHVWEEVLDVRPVGVRDAFLDLGGDSLSAVRMIERVEAALGRTVSLAHLLSAATVEELARALLDDQPPDLRAPLVPLHGDGAKPPFFFLHGDYWSDGLYCLHAARHLDPDRPFWLLPPCGLDGGPIPETVEAMAEAQLGALRRVQPHGPYRLGGNCNGGLVAFEMARRLEGDGERVELLVVIRASARGARHRWQAAAARLLATGLGRRSEGLLWQERLLELRDAWMRASGADRLRLLRAKLRQAPRALAARPAAAAPAPCDGAGTPPGRARRERLRDVYTRAAALYVPRPYPGRVTLFWPERDEEIPSDAARWWKRVAAEVELQVLPGDHLSYATKHVEAFARKLRAELDRVAVEPPGRAGTAAC